MNDMNIRQVEGSRNYSLHWRDGHVVGGHPTVWGWMVGNHSTMPLPDTRKIAMLPRFVALSVSLTRTAPPLHCSALQLGHRLSGHGQHLSVLRLGHQGRGRARLHLDHVLHVVLPAPRHWARLLLRLQQDRSDR